MQSSAHIQFLCNNEIDKLKWDECIENSSSSLIYAKSFYLDNMSANWSALTCENYDWVLPLTHKKKYGIAYLYQPPFCQQLGIFAKPGIIIPYREIFIWMQQQYAFWEINWNFHQQYEYESKYAKVKKATNFVLNLNNSYLNISKNYHHDLQKNLKRNATISLQYHETKDFKKCLELYKKLYGARMPHVKENDYKNLENLLWQAHQKKMLLCRQVTNKANEMLAAALILFDGKRLYNLINITTNEGRKASANHFLLDAVINEFSGKNLLLDFEGSDLAGVKNFYENFGGINQPYFQLKYNHLPWPLKLFKK